MTEVTTTGDTITILHHGHNLLAKTWRVDGSIDPYGDAKFFTRGEAKVSDLAGLSALLSKLQGDPHRCVIRGRYVGDELAAARDPERQPGKVRRMLDYFDDQPLHAVLIDVDKFKPCLCDPLEDPAEAIAEFIHLVLPEPFHSAGYHWQLSNSAGHPSKADGQLRVHLWFWLAAPRTSAELKAWAVATGVAVDKALFNPVQVHYTAAPLMDHGVVDPIAQRCGLVPGPAVDLVIDAAVAEAARAAPTGGRGQRLREVAADDPVAQRLAELDMVLGPVRDGFNIQCPFADGHTPGSGGETSTQYRLPNTGGRVLGHFVCLHDSCSGRGRWEFLRALGLDDPADDFEVVTLAQAEAADAAAAAIRNAQRSSAPTVPPARALTTDQKNAERLVSRFGRRLMVVGDEWYAWTGMRWEKRRSQVYEAAQRLSAVIEREADWWAGRQPKDEADAEVIAATVKALQAWKKQSEMKSTIEAAIGLARHSLTVDSNLLDKDPWALNCLNGTVDLRTGELRPHNPTDLITKLAPVNFDPSAPAPVWQQVLVRVTREEGREAAPVASFLRRWFGYCCTGSTREQKFVVHYGQGSNGKSTVLDTIAGVLGDYAGAAAPGLMVSSGKDRHPTEIADLFGRRMMTAHETGEGGVLREDFIKQATGGDKIKARFMRADFFEFSPTHKLQLLTNHKPVIKGQDHGIWRRVLLVPYEARWGSAEEVDQGTANYVKDESTMAAILAEREGVLAWLVRGAAEWYRAGLNAPDAVMAASRDYKAEQDRVAQFVAACCEVGAGFEVPLSGDFGGLYEEYRNWCAQSGTMPLAKNRLFGELQRVVPTAQKAERKVREGAEKRKDKVFVVGLRLLAD